MADERDPQNLADDQGADAELIELASRIFGAARSGDQAALAAFLDAGTPANLSNDSGDTLLMLAAYHGHADAVRLLLARGADPDRANDRGQTPLAGAVFKGADDVLSALLEGGADPEAGQPSAVATAQMFGKDDLLARFAAR
ncbi:ankyrin repeat protein [Kitasatospora sp. MAA4]|uniref:ankyrin repeat domain-containing protein n=1 Tax=Kitasatospora sp. MAA4 TaxID=3035093 RepID=UPI002475F6AE|nr:ankyrin repeat domain-containing protein [Kitasatospora sp. MAA4]MDH6131330.1 ankyrin repeat protein [Kitasatospora sp. MAA4]